MAKQFMRSLVLAAGVTLALLGPAQAQHDGTEGFTAKILCKQLAIDLILNAVTVSNEQATRIIKAAIESQNCIVNGIGFQVVIIGEYKRVTDFDGDVMVAMKVEVDEGALPVYTWRVELKKPSQDPVNLMPGHRRASITLVSG